MAVRVEVGLIRSVECFSLEKNTICLSLWLLCLLSSEDEVVRVTCSGGRKKSNKNSGNKHFDWFIFPQLLLTSTIWFSLDRKQWRCNWSLKKIETFWFFQIQFHRANDSSYNPVFFLFTWQGYKNSFDSDFVVFGRLENSNYHQSDVQCSVKWIRSLLSKHSRVHWETILCMFNYIDCLVPVLANSWFTKPSNPKSLSLYC